MLLCALPVRIVAPLVGAWIEIDCREERETISRVAPLVGAWIEIRVIPQSTNHLAVAPRVGAWIEISSTDVMASGMASLPLWERGLKL